MLVLSQTAGVAETAATAIVSGYIAEAINRKVRTLPRWLIGLMQGNVAASSRFNCGITRIT